jgi:RNA polymerase sigma factor (sigma-70 family)
VKGEELNIHRDLIIRSQQHDSIAQAKLYQHYARAMYNICRRMMGDEEEAKDVLQDAFIDAFHHLPNLREISTFSAWIKRIVVNKCINAIRKKKLIVAELDENIEYFEEEDDFEYTQYKAAQILDAVECLPDGCKTVLNLYLFDGYDHKEIAQILGITESASKAQYCKAKGRIRNILDQNAKNYAG